MRKPARVLNLPVEISAHLYIGDYLNDTLQLTAEEHSILGALLLHVWLRGPVRRWRFPSATGLSLRKWRCVRAPVLPLYETAAQNIARWKAALRAYDGKRLPPAEWYIVKTIVLLRDEGTCTYCGTTRHPHVDHVIPISRGGTNMFENLTTACGRCNQSKGSKLLAEWMQ